MLLSKLLKRKKKFIAVHVNGFVNSDGTENVHGRFQYDFEESLVGFTSKLKIIDTISGHYYVNTIGPEYRSENCSSVNMLEIFQRLNLYIRTNNFNNERIM